MKFLLNVVWSEWFVLPLLLALIGAIAFQLSTPEPFIALVCFPLAFALGARAWLRVFDWREARRPRELARVARADERERVITDLEGIVRSTQEGSTHWADRYTSMLQEYLSTQDKLVQLRAKWSEAQDEIGDLSGEVHVSRETIEDLGVEIEVARGEINAWETRHQMVIEDRDEWVADTRATQEIDRTAAERVRVELKDVIGQRNRYEMEATQAEQDTRRAREDVVTLEAEHKACHASMVDRFNTLRSDVMVEMLMGLGAAARRDRDDQDAS